MNTRDQRTLDEVFAGISEEDKPVAKPADTPAPGSDIEPKAPGEPASPPKPGAESDSKTEDAFDSTLNWFVEEEDEEEEEGDPGDGDDESPDGGDDEGDGDKEDKPEPDDDVEEATAPPEVKARAFKRMEDAIQRGGLVKAMAATELRVKKMNNKDKLYGLVDALDSMARSVMAVRQKAQSKLKTL